MTRNIKYSPGCGCCDSCIVFNDTFNRDDGAVGANWTVSSGTWEISSNKLVSSTAGIISPNLSGSNASGIKIEFDITPAAGEFRLEMNSSSEYWGITWGSTATFSNCSGDCPCDIGSFPAGSTYSMRFEYCSKLPGSDYITTMKVYIDDVLVHLTHDPPSAGVSPRLRIVSTSGQYQFDDFKVTILNNNSAFLFQEGCSECLDCIWQESWIPDQLQIVFADFYGDNGTGFPCSGTNNCDMINGTYTLDRVDNTDTCTINWELDVSRFLACHRLGQDPTYVNKIIAKMFKNVSDVSFTVEIHDTEDTPIARFFLFPYPNMAGTDICINGDGTNPSTGDLGMSSNALNQCLPGTVTVTPL